MEMCIDNPREGFGELFDTHPSVDTRVAALVKFTGGHDPGPIALPSPESKATANDSAETGPWSPTAQSGPWNPPQRGTNKGSPVETDSPADGSGPWGPHDTNRA
jgi:heat shock protein HtpX